MAFGNSFFGDFSTTVQPLFQDATVAPAGVPTVARIVDYKVPRQVAGNYSDFSPDAFKLPVDYDNKTAEDDLGDGLTMRITGYPSTIAPTVLFSRFFNASKKEFKIH